MDRPSLVRDLLDGAPVHPAGEDASPRSPSEGADRPVFPFTAVAGQDDLKRALVLCAVEPRIGGVLAVGDRGTAKSTTVRALGQLLDDGRGLSPVVTLPLGATEDRVIGSIDIEAALTSGERRFAPGLLAQAHGGFLYVDEVNLLDDYIVDVLLDVAASGVNIVEREGISHRHPCRFVLIGSGNPEEGELRPQLEDRFGLSTPVTTEDDPAVRVEIVRRRLAFEDDPEAFVEHHRPEQDLVRNRIRLARDGVASVRLDDAMLETIVSLCMASGSVGHRAEVTLALTARAIAAYDGADRISVTHVAEAALPVLRHRVPREAFDTPASVDARLRDVLAATLGDAAEAGASRSSTEAR